jgi:hypothetical protein
MMRLREWTTTVLALAIVAVTLWVALKAGGLVGDSTKIAGMKELLGLLLGPAGVVLGYYFGRVPAEAHAAVATQQAQTANAESDRVRTVAKQAADDLEALEAQRVQALSRGGSVADPSLTEIGNIRRRLRAI